MSLKIQAGTPIAKVTKEKKCLIFSPYCYY